MKKAIALLVAAMLLTGLSACGGSTTADAPAKSDGTSKTETNKEEPKPQPADLTGTWKQTNSNDPSSYMEATISGDTIEVDWIGTDTKSLYWKGTYQAPAAAGDWKWTSQGDTETMASALLSATICFFSSAGISFISVLISPITLSRSLITCSLFAIIHSLSF